MIYITSTAILKEDVFEVQSIYVMGDTGQPSYILTKNAGWSPLEIELPVQSMLDTIKAQAYYSSRLVYAPVRQYDDDDAKSFAQYVQHQITDVNNKKNAENYHKRLFKVLQLVGVPYEGGK